MKIKYVVVGAGLAGLTMAERIATQLNEKVLIIEKRGHIAGNVYDSYDEAGILIHNYGPHTFHTNDKEVFDYICSFTEWNNYVHRVLSYVDGRWVPMPICLETVNQLYDLHLSQEEMQAFMESRREPVQEIRNSEDVVLSQVGRDIYEKFFKHFTIKQWGVSPAELEPEVLGRIPFRTNQDTRYFTDTYQGNPLGGYTRMCQRMIDHPNIEVMLNTDYKDVIDEIEYEKLIYTGPLDDFYDYEYGQLLYRSIRFQFETHDKESYQPVASTRYPMDQEYTRITEFKKMTGQQHPKTTILKEFPCFGGEPYYPYPTRQWNALAERYRQRAAQEKDVIFLGRLGEYRYYDMDDVVRRALDCFAELKAAL